MKKLGLAVAVSAALVSSAFAGKMSDNHAGQFYVAPALGMMFASPGRGLNNSVAGTLSIGYFLANNFSVQFFGADMMPSRRHGEGRFNAFYWGGEGLFHFDTHTRFRPYFGLGLGAMKMEHSRTTNDIALGVDYDLTQNISLNLNYRLFLGLAGNGYHDNLLTLGLTWYFGNPWAGAQSAQAATPAAEAKPVKKLSASQQKALTQVTPMLSQVLPEGVKQCGVDGATPEQGCVTLKGNEVTMHLNVRFLKNKANIRSKFAPAIDRLGSFLQKYTQTDATLFGYASSEGPLSFNKKLSLDRAQQVKQHLVSHNHISASRLTAKGMGISNPIASNETAEGRAMNRRVEAAVSVNLK